MILFVRGVAYRMRELRYTDPLSALYIAMVLQAKLFLSPVRESVGVGPRRVGRANKSAAGPLRGVLP